MDEPIRIRGARQHNLKGIDLDLPRRRMTVVTGPSGSGKSSLALDTLFAEGQRRYVESLSTYAKQFLERMEKPDVDSVEGISPAVAIEQKNPTKTSRSTVGTATEVYDYLRLLWSRVGRTHCPECDRRVRPDTVGGSVDRVLELPPGTRIQVTFPLPRSERVTHALVVANLRAMGFVRLLADGAAVDLSDPDAERPEELGVDLSNAHEILVVVDRLKVDPDERDRLADSLGTCFVEGDGEAVVVVGAGAGAGVTASTGDIPARLLFTERFRCPEHREVAARVGVVGPARQTPLRGNDRLAGISLSAPPPLPASKPSPSGPKKAALRGAVPDRNCRAGCIQRSRMCAIPDSDRIRWLRPISTWSTGRKPLRNSSALSGTFWPKPACAETRSSTTPLRCVSTKAIQFSG